MISIVTGAQWGDEGKGKIIDYLTEKENYDYVVRFAGGDNAGHSIILENGKKIVLRHIPSGILHKNTICYIGPGCVLNVGSFLDEVSELRKNGIDIRDRLFISPQVHIITDAAIKEDITNSDNIGTTKRGIGPTYKNKANRTGFRLIDSAFYKKHLEEYMKDLSHISQCNETKILFEGAQGTLLDLDHGTYPYVTSSSTTAAGAYNAGIRFYDKSKIETSIITKAYTTRVGAGPFPTELHDHIGEKLQKEGNEFGSVTGRPRRCGWLDLPALQYAVDKNHTDNIIITKLDVLDTFEEIKLCTGYKRRGEETVYRDYTSYYALEYEIYGLTPVYMTLPGWTSQPTKDVKKWNDLHYNAQQYINLICSYLSTSWKMISTGPKKEDVICHD